MTPLRRVHPLEHGLVAAGRIAAGLDEVGRGPLAGPVFACAVIVAPGAKRVRGVNDSKLLAPHERERLAPIITARATAWALGAASVREIERHNILQATVLAMRRALGRLRVPPHHVLVDGRALPALGWAHDAIVGGDGECYSIACASIVAKVARDRLMRLLGSRHPGYGWEHNAGYGTREHVAAIQRLGATRHHRRTFLRRIEAREVEGVAGYELAGRGLGPGGT